MSRGVTFRGSSALVGSKAGSAWGACQAYPLELRCGGWGASEGVTSVGGNLKWLGRGVGVGLGRSRRRDGWIDWVLDGYSPSVDSIWS